MAEEPILNEHNKAEHAPSHTAEENPLPIVMYTSEDGCTQLEVKLDGETVWLSQQQMSLIFQTDRTSILRHINNIYKTGELEEESTCAKIAQVRIEGKRRVSREIPFYNLDMIISVGYRVNSKTATTFRKWATSILRQYLLKGYAINQQRLDHYNELKDVVRLMSRAIQFQEKGCDGKGCSKSD